MIHLSEGKRKHLEVLSNKEMVISALAIDQRGSMKKMIGAYDESKATSKSIEDLKALVSKELTKYASAILLDPEYGLPATKVRDKDAGLILAYEKTGYDASEVGRLPDLLDLWSVRRLVEEGANAIKVLLYYDVDEGSEINEIKHAFIERVGDECKAHDIPFFLEILSYDANIDDAKSREYAKLKPRKVNEAVKIFSDERYNVDVLKLEVPVNMKFVEGYAEEGVEPVYTKEEAMDYFNEQSNATDLPFIFLSAGVSMELFEKTLYLAKEAGSTFNGVLCGRATWKGVVGPFTKSEEDGLEWLRTEGRQNIEALNKALAETATPWTERAK